MLTSNRIIQRRDWEVYYLNACQYQSVYWEIKLISYLNEFKPKKNQICNLSNEPQSESGKKVS